jgi:hypothetical protein
MAATLYEKDYYAWTVRTAALLRERRFDEVEIESLAEEIEDMGRSQRRELKSRLEVLIMHLLKWHVQPELRSPSWETTIRLQRRELVELLDEMPSLTGHLEETAGAAYKKARELAAYETNRAVEILPAACPYSVAQILSDEFRPTF